MDKVGLLVKLSLSDRIIRRHFHLIINRMQIKAFTRVGMIECKTAGSYLACLPPQV